MPAFATPADQVLGARSTLLYATPAMLEMRAKLLAVAEPGKLLPLKFLSGSWLKGAGLALTVGLATAGLGSAVVKRRPFLD